MAEIVVVDVLAWKGREGVFMCGGSCVAVCFCLFAVG